MLCNLDKLASLVPASGLRLLLLTDPTNILLFILLTITRTYTLFPSYSDYPHLFSCRWMSVLQAGKFDIQQRDKKNYKPFQQSSTHIQAARNISMPEVSFTLPSLLSRLVYSDFFSCLLYVSFKTHIQSTKHFLVHKKISAELHVRKQVRILSNFFPINMWNLQTHKTSQPEKICYLLLILKLKQTINLQSYILSEPHYIFRIAASVIRCTKLETFRQILPYCAISISMFSPQYWYCKGTIIVESAYNFQVRIHLIMDRLTPNTGKEIPLQAWTGPEGSRRLRFPDFKTIGTWRWQGCQP